ncbi:MAG: methyltransferase domain-containing protein [bacterium]
MEKEYAKYLLRETCQDYNRIALPFTRSRGFIWDISELADYVKSGDKVLDLGCGNGRLCRIFKDRQIDYVGVDGSEELISLAQENYPHLEFQVADPLNLLFPANHFDGVFSIRVLHHFPSREYRLQFLKEAARILKPGGTLVLTVWNVWGCKDRQNLIRLIKHTLTKIFKKSRLDFGDALIPWGDEAMRYYHFFTKNELKTLVEEAGLKVKKIWVTPKENKNSDIYLVAEKPTV